MKKQDIQEITVTVRIEEDGDGFYAYAPALKGLHVGGDTIEETLKNVEDGIHVYLDSLVAHGEPFPEGPHFKVHNYKKPITKEISVSWPSPMMLGDKSKTSQRKRSYAH
ncbi:MAG: type II toxin-antitoxin system HicB family antitoxin [Rhodothermaceae bacterium]|nr:type II toxin-antitoxin system HicB family antitoxin [Rhodothermaceae bacterium]MXZ57697.1 type II toxin-antitoxin system HicB family antitoxin [Rhodothermaceae bacterium]MYB91356.1 type II toxin-antitoxin system HicB family antitoxin [Rhodothermaceae bacterium]MYD68797.1 type II toxin-antitoxin system HicB family antitoxin [Rhodothermaceae bacterium]MYG45451.1 type II toxin-antitoxin system HicB family antitoxin [Rhodothermaceae bacterium]